MRSAKSIFQEIYCNRPMRKYSCKPADLYERSFSYQESNLNDDLPFADESFDASDCYDGDRASV